MIQLISNLRVKNFILAILSLLFFLLSANKMEAQNMDSEQMEKIFENVVDSLTGHLGAWSFQKNEREMFCFTDENHNRMRIISPIALVEKLDKELIKNALIANFHSALDVKYAISDDVMWSVFIHPLKELSDRQLEDAIEQVFSAAETFGTTFTSTDLVFPGPSGGENKEPIKEIKKPAKKM